MDFLCKCFGMFAKVVSLHNVWSEWMNERHTLIDWNGESVTWANPRGWNDLRKVNALALIFNQKHSVDAHDTVWETGGLVGHCSNAIGMWCRLKATIIEFQITHGHEHLVRFIVHRQQICTRGVEFLIIFAICDLVHWWRNDLFAFLC